ncbi:unnamed protein product [Notodromas monacha]|uniref:Chitin-binding type-2 domain-containing protein n=1 Tax=Notodromas monacha TaxID=399045 RepID=A0A7R9BXD6_9CRUS|nr:unnamed protein product [Notodromas monacha]CAG0922155.1 unnamed protein product [Notodromas monacha]
MQCGLVILFAVIATAAGQGKSSDQDQRDAPVECKSNRDFLPDPYQCDKYYECTDNGPTERLCPDGLVFDDTRGGVERCDYPFNVDCGNRLELQPPTSGSLECPRMNGIFAHEDPSVCNVFYLCVGGVHQTYTCDGELHFNEYTGVCEWENVAGRAGCQVKPRRDRAKGRAKELVINE